MRCKNCHEKISPKAEFCVHCGTPKKSPSEKKSKKKITFILIPIFLAFAIFGIIVSEIENRSGNNPIIVEDGAKNTVMIYFDGTNIEEDLAGGGHMSVNIHEALNCGIDTEENNVLFFTGGCDKWHDFDIPSDRDCIYIIEDGNLVLLDESEASSMADPDTLEYFMSYCIENYPAQSYSLIMSDHGGGPNIGLCSDRSGYSMSISELSEALTNVGFADDCKLETIMFDACLMGSIEVAATLKEHANYMVASENVSAVLGSDYTFLSAFNKAESGEDIGIAYVDAFYEKSEVTGWDTCYDITFSCVDLSSIDNVIENADAFFEVAEEDMNTMYPVFSRNREMTKKVMESKDDPTSSEQDSYDLIDLCDFVSKNKKNYEEEAQNLLDSLDEAIVYNRSSSSKMNGLTFYSPFNSEIDSGYYDISFSDSYSDYIKSFANKKKKDNSDTDWWFKSLKPSVSGTDEFYVSMQLTEEQAKDFSYGEYYIFSKPHNIVNNDGSAHTLNDDEYSFVSNGFGASLNNKTLEVKIPNKGCYISSDDGDLLCPVYATKDADKTLNYTNIGLIYVPPVEGETEEDELDSLVNAVENMALEVGRLYLDITGDEVKIGNCYVIENDIFQRLTLPVDFYNEIKFTTFVKKLTFDENSNLLPFNKWESVQSKMLTHTHNTKELSMKMKPLDENADYYVMLVAHDIYGNKNCSEIIPLNISK